MFSARETLVLLFILMYAKGEDYLMAFPYGSISALSAKSKENGVKVQLYFPVNETTVNLTTTENEEFEIPDSWKTYPGIEEKAVLVHVPQDNTVSLYGLSFHVKFTPLPVMALGIYHTIEGCNRYKGQMTLLIVTHEKKTLIEVMLHLEYGYIQHENNMYQSGDVLRIMLTQYQTLTFKSDYNLAGTVVQSSSPVAVFVQQYSFVQIFSRKLAGHQFIIGSAHGSVEGYDILQVTTGNKTQLVLSNGAIINLSELDTHRIAYSNNKAVFFTTSTPTVITTCTEHDSFLSTVPPVSMYTSKCSLPSCWERYGPEELRIMSDKKSNVYLTDSSSSLLSIKWSPIAGSPYMFGKFNSSHDGHLSVTSNTTFSVMVYCPYDSHFFTYCGYNFTSVEHLDKSFWIPDMDEEVLDDYLFAFPAIPNENHHPPYIVASSGATSSSLLIRIKSGNTVRTAIPPFSSRNLTFPDLLISEGVENKSLILRKSGTSRFSLFAGFKNGVSNFVSPLPVKSLGKQYTVVVCKYDLIRSVSILTHSQSAEVTINFMFANSTDSFWFQGTEYRSGDVMVEQLQEYQTLTLITDADLTGTTITSSQTVGVFINNPNLVQLLPDKLAGLEFVVAHLIYSETDTYGLYISTKYNNTEIIFTNRSAIQHIQEKKTIVQYFQFDEPLHFRTTKPVLVHTCTSHVFLHVVPTVSLYQSVCALPACLPFGKPEDLLIISYNTTNVHVNGTSVTWSDVPETEYKIARGTAITDKPVYMSSHNKFHVLSACPPSPYFTDCGYSTVNGLNLNDADGTTESVQTNVKSEGNPSSKDMDAGLIGLGVLLAVAFVCLVVVLPYWMWRRKDIFINKLVYRFQAYEDNDDREFDAFISYRSTEEDESFVVHTLFPKLEKELKFKTCVHFRDFMPGETIANNIIQAVESSRRTVLVLTPSYIQSEFCRFEYQRAQHEMLKQKQRIIPIIFKDITEAETDMDETLRTILSSITYIQWPGEDDKKKLDKFWEKLILAMPKVHRDCATNTAE